MPIFRRATLSDCSVLNNLAAKSEAYWDPGPAHIEIFGEVYRITNEFVESNWVIIAEENDIMLGFYALVQKADGTELELLYIDPVCIGKGLGKIFWNHITNFCKEHRIPEFYLVCGPEPKDFYIKMGAVLIGKVNSLVNPNRKVFKFSYSIP